MRILVIDDEPFMLSLLARQLANLGLREVSTCAGAAEALSLVEAQQPDLIFCDLQMPGMDGVEFLRHLAQRGSYGGAVVLVSGEDQRILQSARRIAQAHRLPVLGVLGKPVTPAQLQVLLGQRIDPGGVSEGRIYGADELRQALAAGELVNYYQPQVAVASGRLAGVETLVRWRHPRDGLVPPDLFVPVAEEHGLIDELTDCVLQGALRQAQRWREAGLDLHLAVNISVENLGCVEFPDRLARAAAEAGVPLAKLVLEVTESRMMRNAAAPLDILTRLRLKHVGLSIDDFGTGHSSLAQLRDLPFDELKVDRGFVHGAWHDAHLGAIVEASCAMARRLGLRSVAEGLEDCFDWEFVRTRGFDLAQGYFIARPMPGEALAGWLAGWERRRMEDLEAAA
jgi:EAL domain-containing protein (putative c-di-GMP-specific phosphodiesterase class I)